MNFIQTKNFHLATYPAGDKTSSKLALVLPGKLDTKDYPHMRSHTEYLASRGYFAISFDPPGTWESPGDIRIYTMTNYLTAVNELIEYFGNKPTFVMGHSMGGSVAMLAGIRNPHITHFASIMSDYSFDPKIHSEYSDEEWREKGYRISMRDIQGTNSEQKEFKVPYSFFEDQIQYDMLEGLKQSNKPKLFIYGKNDITIKPEIVKKVYDSASSPKELKELDSGHDYRYHNNLISEVNNLIGDFLKINQG